MARRRKPDGHGRARFAAFQRAGHRCQRCGYRPVSRAAARRDTLALTLHHRNGDWRDERPANLEVLCWLCHRIDHRMLARGRRGTRRGHLRTLATLLRWRVRVLTWRAASTPPRSAR